MKSHTIIIAALATTLAACTPKTETKQDKDMNTLTFNKEQAAAMAAIACNEAKADYTALALNMGLTEAQLRDIAEALKANGLQSEASRAESAIATVVDGQAKPYSTSAWPLGEPNTAYAQYFIGNSYLALLDPASGLCNVSFEPGCRNNWHVHHGAVQMLICVSGRGWYQEWGKEPVELKPGVVIAVPEGVKHWHGAAADSWMQHLTYHANVQPGNSNEWLEPVDDEWYGQLK